LASVKGILNSIRSFLRKLSDEFAEIRFAAASLSFSTLFAIIPFLVVILAVFQSVGELEKIYPQVESLLMSYLKEATGNTVTQYLKSSVDKLQSRTLGYTGVIFLLFTTIGLFRNIDTAFHHMWRIKPRKPFLQRMWLHSIVLISLPVLLAGFIGLRSVKIIDRLSNTIHQQFLFGLVIALALWILYTVIPDTKVSKRASMISAGCAAFGITVVQSSFLWVSLRVFKQNKIYGSLASFPIFMFWLLVVWSIVLAGASLCAYLQLKYFRKGTISNLVPPPVNH
jgi:membrane protein